MNRQQAEMQAKLKNRNAIAAGHNVVFIAEMVTQNVWTVKSHPIKEPENVNNSDA